MKLLFIDKKKIAHDIDENVWNKSLEAFTKDGCRVATKEETQKFLEINPHIKGNFRNLKPKAASTKEEPKE